MHLPEFEIACRAKRIGIGRCDHGSGSDSFRANLGSCVGLVIVWPPRGLFTLAHILLPAPPEGVEPEGAERTRFASTAVEHLAELLEVEPVDRRELSAYIAGGSNLFQGEEDGSVGHKNVVALRAALKLGRVRVREEDMEGEHSRQFVVDGETRSIISINLDDDSAITWEFPRNYRTPKAA